MKMLKILETCYLNYKAKYSVKNEVYFIEVNGNNTGFFALLRAAVDGCCYAYENGYRPYVKYAKETLYSENTIFMGTNNPFEYYFEQPQIIRRLVDLKKISVIRSRPLHFESIEIRYNLKPLSYLMEESYIVRMAEIYKNYIRLNRRTNAIVERSIWKILKGKKTLGIHIRGTDFNKEFNNHPIPVKVDEYIETMNRELCQQHYEQVFIATDDERCLKELQKKISVPLVFYKDVMRTNDNRSVAFKQNERKHNHYLLGLEVLRDAYTLAACEGFLGCLSQIDMFVQIIKLSKGQKFASLNIINKGIYNNNRQCWEPRS